jgi:hypothetical protein
MSPETEERIGQQLARLNQLVSELATEEELRKFRRGIILWIIGTNVVVGGVLLAVILWLNIQMINQLLS